jgi:hypothetical protein
MPEVTPDGGTTAQMPTGSVRTEEWRVSWTMWVPERDQPTVTYHTYEVEGEARAHLEGLQAMQADHELRRCASHVWRPTLDRRVIWQGPWTAAEPPT